MFQKGSFTIPSDSSGVLLVKVIQVRRCSTKKHGDIGKFARVVLRNTKTKLIKRRKKKLRAIIVRSQRVYFKSFGLYYQFATNDLVLLKKRMNTVGKELYGPTSKQLRIKKFRVAFRHVYKVRFFIHLYNSLINFSSVKFFFNLFFLKYNWHTMFKSLYFPFFFKNIKCFKVQLLKIKVPSLLLLYSSTIAITAMIFFVLSILI